MEGTIHPGINVFLVVNAHLDFFSVYLTPFLLYY